MYTLRDAIYIYVDEVVVTYNIIYIYVYNIIYIYKIIYI